MTRHEKIRLMCTIIILLDIIATVVHLQYIRKGKIAIDGQVHCMLL